jgi:hypothetical protein
MSRPTCKRCGRTLKDPVSIARGLGPVCAGSGGSSSRRRPPRTRDRSGARYEAVANGSGQLRLFAQGSDPDETVKMSKRARIAAAKERRRLRFQLRRAFQCGLNGRTREPVVYSPTPEGGWTNTEGYTTSHAALEKYLRRYGWI